MRKLLTLLLLLPLCLAAQTLRQHKVSKGETLWGISHQYGITVDDLVAANPEMQTAGYVLKKGSTILIPTAAKEATATPAVPATSPKEESASPSAATDAVRDGNAVHIALVMPFVGTNLEHARSVEFYRGFLLGVERLKAQGKSVTISAYNEPRQAESIALLMNDVRRTAPDIVIGPVYPSHVADIASLAQDGVSKVVIPFTSKVEQVHSVKDVFLLNTPDAYETLYGCDLVQKYFSQNATQRYVFLRSAKSTMLTLTYTLKNRLREAGAEVHELNADATASDLAALISRGGRTLFVADSDEPAAARTILTLVRDAKAEATGGTASVLGFTEWLSEEKSLRPLLRSADAFILTPHFFYPATTATLRFAEEYRQWFGDDIGEAALRMVPLGYDCCLSVVSGVLRYGKDFATQERTGEAPLQTNFEFTPLSGGGYINRNLWLVHYQTNGGIQKIASGL